MTNRIQHFKEGLLKLFARADMTLDGDVKSVDESNYTCTVVLPNGLELNDVQLKALRGVSDCVVLIPKVGSGIQIVNVGDPDYMMLSADEVDKVIIKAAVKVQIDCDDVEINGGGNGGLVIIDELKNNIGQLKSYCEALNSTLSSVASAVTSVGGQTATGLAYTTGMAGKVITFTNMENTKVKH